MLRGATLLAAMLAAIPGGDTRWLGAGGAAAAKVDVTATSGMREEQPLQESAAARSSLCSRLMRDSRHQMRTEAPALIPIFRSDLQGRLLLRVLTDEEPHTASELARFLDAPEPTVHREASRLADAGLLLRARVGRLFPGAPGPQRGRPPGRGQAAERRRRARGPARLPAHRGHRREHLAAPDAVRLTMPAPSLATRGHGRR